MAEKSKKKLAQERSYFWKGEKHSFGGRKIVYLFCCLPLGAANYGRVQPTFARPSLTFELGRKCIFLGLWRKGDKYAFLLL